MTTFISILSAFKKMILLLCCVVAISLALFCSSAFAAPPQQATLNTDVNVSIGNTICNNIVQTKTPLSVHSNALLHDVSNGTITNSRMYNLASSQDNENTQDSKTPTLSANNQPITLNAVTNSTVIGYIVDNRWITSYTNVDDFVKAINNASFATIYLNQDIALNNTIKIKDEAKITINLSGHVLSGKNISGHLTNDNEPIIKVGYKSNLTVIGSENGMQASLAHTLNGFDECGNKQSYSNVCGGVITADQDDDIIGIYISNNNSTVTLNNTTIFGCIDKEDEGAGIDVCGENTKLDLEYSSIQHCNAQHGGAIHVSKNADNTCISMAYSSIDNNHANYRGAGLYICGKKTKLNLNFSSIQHCFAGQGAGIYLGNFAINSSISMADSTIDSNNADYSGSGIYCDALGVTIEDTECNPDNKNKSTISNNTAGNNGGGIYYNNDEKGIGIHVNGIDISNNEAQYGGGVYLMRGNNTFDECTFTGNVSIKAGSALYGSENGNTLKNCTITGNISKAKTGAVCVCDEVDINLEGLINISNNTGNDLYLAEAGWWRAYIMIDPNKFDLQSRVGVFIEDIDEDIEDGIIFAKTKVGTGNFPVLAKDCFHINNGSYSVIRDDKDRTRLLVVKT